mmetsp:Transcript_6113/g.14074  ORF Transcript_6113/g.14074 Transcript_6113/m.14074 type:complete len:283 (-) Transcript_6113:1695-2543(-)
MPSSDSVCRARDSTDDLDRRRDGDESDRRKRTRGSGSIVADSPSSLDSSTVFSSSPPSSLVVSSGSTASIGSNQLLSSSRMSRRLSTARSSLSSSSPSSISLAIRSEMRPNRHSALWPNLPSEARRQRWPMSEPFLSSSGSIVCFSSLFSESFSRDCATRSLTPDISSSSIRTSPHPSECARAMPAVSCCAMVALHTRLGVAGTVTSSASEGGGPKKRGAWLSTWAVSASSSSSSSIASGYRQTPVRCPSHISLSFSSLSVEEGTRRFRHEGWHARLSAPLS